MTTMTSTPTESWATYMKSLRGQWSIDPVHNGKQGRILAFRPDADDATRGVYVELDVNTGKCSAGRYEDAYPHIGEAFFMPNWEQKFTPSADLAERMFVRLGLNNFRV